MRGLTHVFFGIGFVSLLLGIFKTPNILWGVGTFLIVPIFSRLPDQDQKIAKITFNQVVPHRGKGTHNLLYGIPILLLIVIQDVPIIGSVLAMLVGSIFGAIFIHSFVDAFN
ncbi:MAG: metal-dependent hydrolase, partial [Candidatus Hodarchaeota archaeon]